MIRPPDINLDSDVVPDGCILFAGNHFQQTVRAAKIPFGLATRRIKQGRQLNTVTQGVLIFETDSARMDVALARRAERQLTGKPPRR